MEEGRGWEDLAAQRGGCGSRADGVVAVMATGVEGVEEVWEAWAMEAREVAR